MSQPEPEIELLIEDRDYIWAAIDLLVQELGRRGDTSQWFRDQWTELVRMRTRHASDASVQGEKP